MNAKISLALSIALLMLLGSFIPANTPLGIPSARATAITPYYSYYYGPRMQKLFITTFNDPTSEYGALKGGTLDASDWPLSASQQATLSADKRWQANVSADLTYWNIPMNAGRYPSNYTAYRQAIGYMINRDNIITTALGGLGGKMPDQLTPSWPASWHVPGGIGYDQDLKKANQTLYNGGFRYTGGSTGFWYNIVNSTNKIDPSKTIFIARSDDPNRLFIGTQLAADIAATKGVYHFDRLITVIPLTSAVAKTLSYKAPACGYTSNNCAGTGFPAFTAYTAGSSPALFPDADVFYFSFSADSCCLDVIYQNFGHYVNTTINADVHNMQFAANLDTALVQKVNREVTEQAWWIPMYYEQDWSGASDRVTGHLSGQNGVVPGGSFNFANYFSFWRGHLKGRAYGGSIRLGDYNPINQLNPDNPDSTWVYDADVLNRVFDFIMNYNYDTGLLTPELASAISVSVKTSANLPTGFDYVHWKTAASAPYWQELAGPRITVPSATRADLTLYANATWHDGHPVTANDIIWNIVEDAIDLNNLQEPGFAALADINATDSTHVTLWFNDTSWDFPFLAIAAPMLAPLPWIHAKAGTGNWAATDGVISTISLSSKTSLNLSAGSLNMLDASGPFMFDSATAGDPFTVGSTFDLVANNNWHLRDGHKATYDTGIAVLSPYLGGSAYTAPSTGIPLKVALLNGNNAKGLTFQGGTVNDYVPDVTQSDTTTGTVTAIVAENPSLTTSLTYSSTDKLWEGTLPVPSDGKTYHIQITATTANSATTYGPAGTSQASASGVSWEGDPYHTQFTAPGASPVTPIQLLAGLLTVLAVIPVARRTRRIRI